MANLDSNNYSLERFTTNATPQDPQEDANTVWLFDKQNKVYYPVESPAALAALLKLKNTPEDIGKAFTYVNVVNTSVLNDPAWQGKFVQRKDSIKEDGNIPASPSFIDGLSSSPSSASSAPLTKYGKQDAGADLDQTALNTVGLILTTAKNKGFITQATFDKYASDHSLMANYANATLYGGYDISTILQDIKAKELADSGNTAYQNFQAFSSTVPANQWYNTPEGQKVQGDSQLIIPPSIGISADILNNSITKIPDAAFQTLTPILDWNSPEMKAEADKIKASYYDIKMEQADAQTEQDKALADNKWNNFKTRLEKQYGLKLSNNANTAWDQLSTLTTNYSSRGIANSGIMQEAEDRRLREVRSANAAERTDMANTKADEQRDYLLTSGSSKDIQNFINSSPENKALAQSWGLIPSDSLKTWLDPANLKQLYPDLSDADIQAVRSTFVDENGNNLSTLYRNLNTNKYDLGKQKKTYQMGQVQYDQNGNITSATGAIGQNAVQQEKDKEAYTMGNPLSSYQPNGPTDTSSGGQIPPASNPTTLPTIMPANTTPASSTPSADPMAKMREYVRQNIVSSTPTPAAPTPAPVTPTPTQPEAPSYKTRDYVIKSGDTLSGIAKSQLGNAGLYKDIASWNNIANPNLIRAGDTIKIRY